MKIKLSNGIELFYKKLGQGPNLILMHGNGDDHQGLLTLAQGLQEDFTIYLVDSRCHGQSSCRPFDKYETLADDIDLFIRTLQLESVSLMGHSDGAIIATLLAIQNPPYLDKIIPLSVTLNPHDIKKVWTDWIHSEYAKTQDPLFKLMIDEPNIPIEDLSKIKVPTLVYYAEDDVMEVEHYEAIHQAIPGAEAILVSGEDHISYVIDNDLIVPDVKAFLQKA